MSTLPDIVASLLLPTASRSVSLVATFPAVAAAAQVPSGPTPTAPAVDDYGSDLSCATDITADAKELTGDDPLIVAESDVRRLTTDRGTLIDDPDFGWNLEQLIQKPMTPAEVATIAGQVRGELVKDDRHETLNVWTTGQTTSNLIVHVRGTTAKGPFRLVMAITDGGVAVKEIYG